MARTEGGLVPSGVGYREGTCPLFSRLWESGGASDEYKKSKYSQRVRKGSPMSEMFDGR